MSPEPLILPGDFNFHMDVASDVDAQVFSNLLTSMGLKQHVTVQTHISGHTLDLLITRENDPVICIACVAWRDWGGSNWFLFFSRLLRSFSHASRSKFAASPLVRPARQLTAMLRRLSSVALPWLTYVSQMMLLCYAL